jgi:hypothetical protein
MVLPTRPAGSVFADAEGALQVAPSMEVYDTFDQKLGAVAHVHEVAAPPGEVPGSADIIEVRTGFLGLGRHLFIPRSALRGVTEDRVFVAASREEIQRHGWDERPAAVDAGYGPNRRAA